MACLALVACTPRGAPAVRAAEATGFRETMLSIPVQGTTRIIPGRLCRPEVDSPVPLVVINHGSPVRASDRATMRAAGCDTEAVRWFTDRGFAALMPLRRGYGPDGGDHVESSGRCEQPDFARAGRQSAIDIESAIALATHLPNIRPDGVLLVGQSAGGWAALAVAERRLPSVVGVINMAGGRGGWANGRANTNCRPERLVAAAGDYGRAGGVPMLWIYTANDSFFGPQLASAMHRAFTDNGGTARLLALPAWGQDGHALFFGQGGSATWGPLVQVYLQVQGYAARSR